MTKSFQAVFEAGVLKPLEPLSLNEREVVTLIVAQPNGDLCDDELFDDLIDHDAMAIAEREGVGAVSLEQLHELLKSIPGSMSDAVIEDRGDY